MDIALLNDPVASEDGKLAEIEQLRSRCRLYGGEFTMLWHNSRLNSRRARSLYTAALASA
jgi:hypothetical protein